MIPHSQGSPYPGAQRRVLKPAYSITKLNLPQTDIFPANSPKAGSGDFWHDWLGHGMAWLRYGVAWPQHRLSAWVWRGLDWVWGGPRWKRERKDTIKRQHNLPWLYTQQHCQRESEPIPQDLQCPRPSVQHHSRSDSSKPVNGTRNRPN